MGTGKMMKTERIGMVVLSILVLLFAVLALMRGCGRGEGRGLPAVPDSAAVTSVDSARIDTAASDSAKRSAVKKKKKVRKKRKNSTKTNSAVRPYQRHHRSEPVSTSNN